MTHDRRSFLRAIRIFCLVAAVAVVVATARANPALDGYADYESFSKEVAQLAESDFVSAASLGTTLGGRKIYLLTVGTGRPDAKPAFLVVGNVYAPHLVGSELAVRIVRRLAAKAEKDDAARKLLDRFTFYVIPRPSPDAAEKCFAKPFVEQDGNLRKTDDDRDGRFGEDPPNDLNGDGWITMMRVRDDTGSYMPHPDDGRVLIKADPKKNERPMYRLYVEGRDDDGDEAQSEDAAAGISFNRNFTFRYPYFKRGAGPHQVSEAETRAVADFAFDHPNIALVFTFTPEDNLMHPWKPNATAERARVKTAVLSADAPYFDLLAARYRKILGAKDAPPSPKGEGSFSEWAYFHFGRWSLAARAWWVPKVSAKTPPSGKPPEKEPPGEKPLEKTTPPDGKKSPEKKTSGEKRGADEINALRWFAAQKIDGFVGWTPVKHPDFPGRKVEVGGLKPFYRLNPPARELDGLADAHFRFLAGLAELMPQVKIDRTKVEPLGSGVYRITATVVNRGYLPTTPEMGRLSRYVYPMQVEIRLPEGAKLLDGPARTSVDRLAGGGGHADRVWMVRVPDGKPAAAKVSVRAPNVGSHEVEVLLKEPASH